jgi:predicted nucleic acid-binding protein
VAYLLDTTVLVRLANAGDVFHKVATGAILELHRRGEVLNISSQVLIEFRAVATRPVAVNGIGLSVAEVEAHAATFEGRFPLLPDTPDVFPSWKTIVSALGVIGKQVHDARLVAVCHVHNVTHLLTFNLAHFTRIASFSPGIVVCDPAKV